MAADISITLQSTGGHRSGQVSNREEALYVLMHGTCDGLLIDHASCHVVLSGVVLWGHCNNIVALLP